MSIQQTGTPLAKLLPATLTADPGRTVLRPFELATKADRDGHEGRLHRLVEQIEALDDDEVEREVRIIEERLKGRHRGSEATLRRNALAAAKIESGVDRLADRRFLLLGGYLTQEYAFEAAALFNPSVMPHPDQKDVPDGAIRLVLSLRGIGEGHVSSITFRALVWHGGEQLEIEAFSTTAVSPNIELLPHGAARLTCDDSEEVSESVLFPVMPSQSRGLEDLRLVRLTEEDGSYRYLGTFTASGDSGISLQLMEGHGFRRFDLWPTVGELAASKGGALFPRRIGGEYMMVSRHDGESLWIAASSDLIEWTVRSQLMTGREPWEWAQIGNCGSPIEIAEGWLLLTHGVGTIRSYSIGACLLDREDPTKVLARLYTPLLTPESVGRDGYVPNVVYSCGGVVLGRTLLLPFGIADWSTGFGLVDIDALLAAMCFSPPRPTGAYDVTQPAG